MRLLTKVLVFGLPWLSVLLLTAPAGAQTTGQMSTGAYQSDQFVYGWFWDPADESWKYGWYQPSRIGAPPEYTLTYSQSPAPATGLNELRGRIMNIEQRRVAEGAPLALFVTVRTEEGTIRTIGLGDAAFVYRNLPRLYKGDTVYLRGQLQNVAGRDFFNAAQIVTAAGAFDIPQFGMSGHVRGRLVNLYTVPGRTGFERTLVAQVRTPDNNIVDVMIGPMDEVGNRFYALQPGTPIEAEGYIEQQPSGARLYAQNIRFQEREPGVWTAQRRPSLALSVEPQPAPSYMTPTTQAVRGRILDVYPVLVSGQWRLLAEIQTDTGNFIRTDLGPRENVDFLDLARGDLITATGRMRWEGNEPILLASQFNAHGQTLFVQSAPRLVGAAEPTTPAQMFRGQILNKHSERVPGFKDKHELVDLRLDDGRVMVVDLGAKKNFKGIDLDKNDYIAIWAQEGTVFDRPALIAFELQKEGRRAQLGPFERD